MSRSNVNILNSDGTSFQNLLDFDVVGTESTVELEVVSIIKERASQREKKVL